VGGQGPRSAHEDLEKGLLRVDSVLHLPHRLDSRQRLRHVRRSSWDQPRRKLPVVRAHLHLTEGASDSWSCLRMLISLFAAALGAWRHLRRGQCEAAQGRPHCAGAGRCAGVRKCSFGVSANLQP
jgi:hypothetical protein